MTTLLDQPDRDRARHALDETIFVTAGAGAGKTKVLVDRICSLVTDPANPVPMRAVAAVTFTEKAAAEMRDKIRAELSKRAHDKDAGVAQRARDALDELDMAAIGTLHSFASRLLMENPIEAHLPPVISPMDEVASSVRSERWWSQIRTALLEGDATAEAMQVLMAAGVGLDAIRDLTRRLQADWDLVEERCPRGAGVPDLRLDLEPLRVAVVHLARRAADECFEDGDKLFLGIGRVREWLTRLEEAVDDLERLELLGQCPKLGNVGTMKNWADVASVRADAKDLVALACDLRDALVQSALDVVVAALAQAVLDEADRRRQDGSLQFQDLLVLARNVLRDSEAARMAAHQRYQRLLLDEFQDTDPVADRDRGTHRCRGQWRSCALAGLPGARGIPVRRRGRQAVDLPVPPRQHRHLPGSAGRPRGGEARGALHQLPLPPSGAGVGQHGVRSSDRRRARRAAALPTAEPRPGSGGVPCPRR